MDDVLKEVLAVATPTEQAELKILHNATVVSMRKYKENPGKKTLRDWEAAKEAYSKRLNEIAVKYKIKSEYAEGENDKPFENIHSIHKWLIDNGWKVSPPTLYRHRREGKLRPNLADGKWSRAFVKEYATKYLRRQKSGVTISKEEQDSLVDQKLRQQIRKLKAEASKAENELERLRGTMIPREEVEPAMAARAVALMAGLQHTVTMRAPDWCELVGGDEKRIRLLVETILDDLARWFGDYARPLEIEVEFGQAPAGNGKGKAKSK